jgi:hypothetical protein
MEYLKVTGPVCEFRVDFLVKPPKREPDAIAAVPSVQF